MRRVSLAVVLVLCAVSFAQAAITLNVGDHVWYQRQTPSQFQGQGGAFDWHTGDAPISPLVTGTYFQTFCAEVGEYINPYTTYKVDNFYNVAQLLTGPASPLNLNISDTKGIYLLNWWNTAATTAQKTSANAAAVQMQLWVSEGYTADIYGNIGSINVATALAQAGTLLGGWGTGWMPPVGQNYEMAVLKTLSGGTAQDQYVWVSNGHNTGVPEPASIAIWAAISGMGVAGVAIKRRKNRWSDENRQAIMSIFEPK